MAFLLRGTQQLGIDGNGGGAEECYDRPSRFPYISRTLERPLILHRLVKPEIKKGNMLRYTYIEEGDSEKRNGLPRRPLRTGSPVRPVRPGALLLLTRVLGASRIRFALKRTRSNEQTIIRDERKHHRDNNVTWRRNKLMQNVYLSYVFNFSLYFSCSPLEIYFTISTSFSTFCLVKKKTI